MVTYRVVARFFFESQPRPDMAHKLPVDQAHRAPAPEPLWLAVVVLVAGLVGIWFVVTVVLAGIPG